MSSDAELVNRFIGAACVPLDDAHTSGTLERAESIASRHGELAGASIHAAAILGDAPAVREWLARDPALATTTGGPRGWDPLTHLCFSRYLRLDPARSDGFVSAAEALLDAGASANSGWREKNHRPEAEWESVLYGAAGIAHHAGLTRLLLERGADPNDNETPYHAAEGYDNAALELLVESGRLTADSLVMMLVRKIDWHDARGIAWLLDHGAPADQPHRAGFLPLHHALVRDSSIDIIELLLEHGADPERTAHGRTAVAHAAHAGRRDALALFARRGVSIALDGADALLVACATGDDARARAIVHEDPALRRALAERGGALLGSFASVGNTEGVRLLLDLGVPVDAPATRPQDGYWSIAPDSTALHVAAWRGRDDTVTLLLDRGAAPDRPDGAGRTPLALAVRACVDSWWTERCTTRSAAALLRAGASTREVPVPTGHAALDALLAAAV